ncbi:hypothetical protein PIB30_064546 [Stylosanthes scabra]|uniref:Uncharacterized protein n=1 Tax=Stylosanthes scabra TaxID=79078 RepID=A0ABU6WMT8_9FABA|nr:hypothetical protein [Stylosanthes scabra]
MKTPHPPVSPVSMLQPKKLLVLAMEAETLRTHSKAAGNLHTPTTGDPRTTKVRRTARISMKPIKRRLSARIAAKGIPSKVAPEVAKEEEVDPEEEEVDPEEEEEDPEEDPEADILDHFFDTDSDYVDYLALDDLDPSDSSEGSS